jgi:hypothetical protein
VIHKGQNDRVSVPFFYNPSIDAQIGDMCYGQHLSEKLAGYHEMAGYSSGTTTAQLAAGAPARSTKEKDDASFTITFKGVDSDGRSDNSNTVCVKSV